MPAIVVWSGCRSPPVSWHYVLADGVDAVRLFVALHRISIPSWIRCFFAHGCQVFIDNPCFPVGIYGTARKSRGNDQNPKDVIALQRLTYRKTNTESKYVSIKGKARKPDL